ncbi:efflux RND transporter periplasmic adaptor subunit [Neolewinella lacunae]|uniref:Efflux RND transporter periplasmic adaptor subunit n=1 Tax=Neolewinella lacunae TaxID=1517758 RepID=A0A923PJG3_9BACT|nr:efflux RND transporter periplasmic adaptor subunit [Neolewinella lacunae]MBC6995207.1 efflux RND transporter periplasmic adaptor subunit [Neolewinella lacunae]MDN3635484.1 efflux RND transporter periplasmic adaptor subunit [Neolewinella lacunae]
MKRTIKPFAGLCLVVALAACGKDSAEVSTPASSASSVMQADYVVVQPQPVSNVINLTGTLLPSESAMLSAQSSGLVKEILFREGQYVKKGQELLKLDDRQWVVQRQKLAAQLETAEKDLERRQELLKIKGISQAEVDAAELLVATIQADQAELAVLIDFAVVRAPFSGRMGLRNISPGAYLAAGTSFARLVQTDPLKLEFNVPERYAHQIRVGQEVRFSIAGEDDVFAAKVYATDPAVSESTRSLRIRATVTNQRDALVPGAFTEISLTLGNVPDALLVPTEAVVPVLNDQIVYRISGGKIEEVVVKTGIRLPRLMEVVSGLEAGDTIMVSGLLQAKDGVPVRAGQEIIVNKTEVSKP